MEHADLRFVMCMTRQPCAQQIMPVSTITPHNCSSGSTSLEGSVRCCKHQQAVLAAAAAAATMIIMRMTAAAEAAAAAAAAAALSLLRL
jgi:hypothetical protein